MIQKLVAYLIFSAAIFSGYAQEDTTKKPIDTTMVSVQLTDTVQVHLEETAKEQPTGPVYKMKVWPDLPLIVGGTAFSLYGFSNIYNKDASSVATINSLRKSDISAFDRGALENYSDKADAASDMFFYGSMPTPFLLMIFDKKIRKDAGKVALLYWETLAMTGIYYTGTPMLVDRYRPFAYNTSVPIEKRTTGNAKNSFIGGHPALVGTCTFFMAKIYSDYHPESKAKWVFYTFAAAATTTTAILRYKAGRHFPSDLLVGTIMGPLTGILVPHFHKNKLLKNKNMTIMPFTGESHGLAFVYKL
jgi:membrane-associated phospholipid phosphatase